MFAVINELAASREDPKSPSLTVRKSSEIKILADFKSRCYSNRKKNNWKKDFSKKKIKTTTNCVCRFFFFTKMAGVAVWQKSNARATS